MAPSTTGVAKTAAGGSSVRGRTKHEQDQLQRKTVYRPVLDNPLTIAWSVHYRGSVVLIRKLIEVL